MTPLTTTAIAAGLRELGLEPGDRVLVHSSLSALGTVEGGAETVIDALLQAVGSGGMVAMPTFACPAPFDRRTSTTALGVIADRFWRRPDAVRSLHPTHSVAAIGPGAEELLRGHEAAPTAYGEGTPYHRLATGGGKILLLGADQDRNTTLHTAETLAGACYLRDIRATYIDDAGQAVTIPVAAMAGPHRGFIGLDRLFHQHGVMRTGRIGRAMCRLLDGAGMLRTALEALRRDPAAVLCDNPCCSDCVAQRAMIRAAQIALEPFTLSAVAADISADPDVVIAAIRSEGIGGLEVTAAEHARFGDRLRDEHIRVAAIRGALHDEAALHTARALGAPLVVPVASAADAEAARVWSAQHPGLVRIENAGQPAAFYVDLYTHGEGTPPLAFSPAAFAAAGEKPFLGIFNRGMLRKRTAHFMLADATAAGEPTLPGRGCGEVAEILSMLRCRGFDGVVTLRSHAPGCAAFREAAAALWRLMDAAAPPAP